MLHVGNLVYPGFDIMTMSALSVFEYANAHLEEPRYDVRLVSERAARSKALSGLRSRPRRSV